MDAVGSEIGQKMRSAIKAKLTELGCYVDDELPDYVMVMVANKRTRLQMEEDLQLFLGDNTELFVNWLHQVLKKLQEVTVATPSKPLETEKIKDKSKDRKNKDKKIKEKSKKTDGKKTKKKDKIKLHRKKEEKKAHKSKKKSKHHEMIRPNIPPLLMNIEKESEPSITDVFAGQILKNHGIILDTDTNDLKIEKKTVLTEAKRPILPIIDPATISSQPDSQVEPSPEVPKDSDESTVSINGPREEQIKEMNKIEAKIQGLKQKLVEQLDSMSEDDEDFLNIRTEAEELMNDFAEDVFQEISQQTSVATPPITPQKSPTPSPVKPSEPIPPSKQIPVDPIETLPQFELKLPKRPIRERLGAREEPKKVPEAELKEPVIQSPERFTPEREPEVRSKSQNKSVKSRLGNTPERKNSSEESHEKAETTKRLTSKVSTLESRSSRVTCASVVRVRPRPRVAAPASSLLLRAVADAHKSLLNTPPKMETDHKVKRALVLPMRRCTDPQKIVIQVAGTGTGADTDSTRDLQNDTLSIGDVDIDSDDDKSSKVNSEPDKEDFTPTNITKKITNDEYVGPRRNENRTTSKRDNTLIIETINIHNPTVDKDKKTQFIVTMDGYHPNAFLAKKLLTEGLLDEDEIKKPEASKSKEPERTKEIENKEENTSTNKIQKKRFSNTSEESDTQVIIKKDDNLAEKQSDDVKELSPPPVKKRKASPIVFDMGKKEKEEKQRERTESASSDNHITVMTTASAHKFDSVPPLSQAERKLIWCRAFPLCRYGAACAFAHPRCKFAAACTRRNCVYSHSPSAVSPTPAAVPVAVASHVVPVANYKTISAAVPNLCKYYPNCANPTCHFYHPKPCRYGKNCANKIECNFYHNDVPSKWRYPI